MAGFLFWGDGDEQRQEPRWAERACIAAPASAPGLLKPRPCLGRLSQSFADLATIEANIPKLPVAEPSQKSQVCLVLTLGDQGGDSVIDKAAEPPHEYSDRFSNCGWGRGIVRGTVQHCHRNFLQKSGFPFLWRGC